MKRQLEFPLDVCLNCRFEQGEYVDNDNKAPLMVYNNKVVPKIGGIIGLEGQERINREDFNENSGYDNS